MVERVAEMAVPIEVSDGIYLRWSSPCGAERSGEEKNGDILLFSHNFQLPWPPEGTQTPFQPQGQRSSFHPQAKQMGSG